MNNFMYKLAYIACYMRVLQFTCMYTHSVMLCLLCACVLLDRLTCKQQNMVQFKCNLMPACKAHTDFKLVECASLCMYTCPLKDNFNGNDAGFSQTSSVLHAGFLLTYMH